MYGWKRRRLMQLYAAIWSVRAGGERRYGTRRRRDGLTSNNGVSCGTNEIELKSATSQAS